MQTLGLQGESKRSDGRLKSIFWPTVETAWDVDYLGQQGFWICCLLAVFQVLYALFTGNVFAMAIAVPGALLYWIGGMGVRERSWPAAAVLLTCYLFGTLLAFVTGTLLSPVGALRVVFLGLMLSNLRATFIASEWRAPAEGEDQPSRFNESFRDKLVDVWPPRLWPKLQIPFYVLGAMWLLFTLLAVAGVVLMKLGIVHAPAAH